MVSENSLTRNEELWEGSFGREYVQRNPRRVPEREKFWEEIVEWTSPDRTLEVGCGVGLNLDHLWKRTEAWGIDVNLESILLAQSIPSVNAFVGSAFDVPFKDDYFGLSFTCGVLIHQHPDVVRKVMMEVARCSRKWVLCVEYEADEFVEIPYHGENMALFKGPYSTLYGELGLTGVDNGVLGKDAGFDDCTWTLFEK